MREKYERRALHNVRPQRRNINIKGMSAFELSTAVTGVSCIAWIEGAQPCHAKMRSDSQFQVFFAEVSLGCPGRKCPQHVYVAAVFTNFTRSYGVFPTSVETSSRSNIFFSFLHRYCRVNFSTPHSSNYRSPGLITVEEHSLLAQPVASSKRP